MSHDQPRDHTEQELKLALPTEQDYLRARDLLEPAERIVEQTNHYIETPDGRLRGAGMMLRVREDGETVVATLKSGARLSGGTLSSREREAPVEAAAWEAVLQGRAPVSSLPVLPVQAVLDAVGADADLRIRGSMRNRRSVHRAAGFTIELDRTELPDGTVSFEIEVETDQPEEARAALAERLEQAGVRWGDQTLTKYERFLRALEG